MLSQDFRGMCSDTNQIVVIESVFCLPVHCMQLTSILGDCKRYIHRCQGNYD